MGNVPGVIKLPGENPMWPFYFGRITKDGAVYVSKIHNGPLVSGFTYWDTTSGEEEQVQDFEILACTQ